MNKSFSITSTAVFAVSIVCSCLVLLYAGAISGWNIQIFLALAGKSFFLFGLVLPIVGIPLSWHVLRAPSRVEEVIEGVILLICWLSALYIISTTVLLAARIFGF